MVSLELDNYAHDLQLFLFLSFLTSKAYAKNGLIVTHSFSISENKEDFSESLSDAYRLTSTKFLIRSNYLQFHWRKKLEPPEVTFYCSDSRLDKFFLLHFCKKTFHAISVHEGKTPTERVGSWVN